MSPEGGVLREDRVLTLPTATLRFLSGESAVFETHAHSAYTVTALLEGELRLTIGDASATLLSGQVGLTNAGESHAAMGQRFELLSIGFAPDGLVDLVGGLGFSRTTAELRFRHPVANDDAITRLAGQVVEELRGDQPGRVDMIDALLRQLAIHLARTHLLVRRSDRVEWSRAGPVDRRLRLAVEYIHAHYGENLSLEEIAGAAFLSEYHFARLFRQLMGATPHGYLTSVRVEHARRLLVESDTAITDVAARAGFGSQSHFTRVFRSLTGTTPRAYREAARPGV